jgi:hypothetical protein
MMLTLMVGMLSFITALAVLLSSETYFSFGLDVGCVAARLHLSAAFGYECRVRCICFFPVKPKFNNIHVIVEVQQYLRRNRSSTIFSLADNSAIERTHS